MVYEVILEPLPPIRKVKVVREATDSFSLCSMCLSNVGKRTCTACKAVRYCGRDCQKKQWKYHKKYCKKIELSKQRTKIAGEPLKSFKEGEYDDPLNLFDEGLGNLDSIGERLRGGAEGIMSEYHNARTQLYISLDSVENKIKAK